ncbi:hypothetical protein [Burkholderia sp. 22313]|uniref:hypothetical protein n=1 Tax=Burkholderia sp. 22313 TaxID=3453908 RepID=UPI003F860309
MRTIIPFDIHTFLSFLPDGGMVPPAAQETFRNVRGSVHDYESFTMRSCTAAGHHPGSPAGRRFATI